MSTIHDIRNQLSTLVTEAHKVACALDIGDERTEAFIADRPGAIRQALGSAVKFGRIAEGGADIYPRLSPTSEWDVAAGHAD